jgi:hypothetical protein
VARRRKPAVAPFHQAVVEAMEVVRGLGLRRAGDYTATDQTFCWGERE